MKRIATIAAALLVLWPAVVGANGAPGWSPRAAAPSPAAKKVLDSLPDPRRVSIPDDVRRASAARTSTLPPAPEPTRPAPPEPGGACLEVQLAATADEVRALGWAREASEALMTTTRVVPGGGLFRVRAGGCLNRSTADALAGRARLSGWSGAFVTPAQ